MKYGAINIDPETMGGTPVFIGTRVPIKTLFDYMEGGDNLDEFLDDYPTVSKETAIEVLEIKQQPTLHCRQVGPDQYFFIILSLIIFSPGVTSIVQHFM